MHLPRRDYYLEEFDASHPWCKEEDSTHKVKTQTFYLHLTETVRANIMRHRGNTKVTMSSNTHELIYSVQRNYSECVYHVTYHFMRRKECGLNFTEYRFCKTYISMLKG